MRKGKYKSTLYINLITCIPLMCNNCAKSFGPSSTEEQTSTKTFHYHQNLFIITSKWHSHRKQIILITTVIIKSKTHCSSSSNSHTWLETRRQTWTHRIADSCTRQQRESTVSITCAVISGKNLMIVIYTELFCKR